MHQKYLLKNNYIKNIHIKITSSIYKTSLKLHNKNNKNSSTMPNQLIKKLN